MSAMRRGKRCWRIFFSYILAGAFAMAQSRAATGSGDWPDAHEEVTERQTVNFRSIRRP